MVQLFKMIAFLIFVFTVSSLSHGENIASSPLYQEVNNCILPPYPEHGRYTVSNNPSATPGERYPYVKLDMYCDTGYLNNSTVKSIFCINGEWSSSMTTCVLDLLGSCKLSTNDLKVEYRCLWFSGTLGWSWECESIVPSGTLVRPICRSPAYFSRKNLPEMHCRNGKWDYNPICKRACGLTTQHLQLEGTSTKHLELPWNAVIYYESYGFNAICTGSLITDTKIICAASCFHDFKDKLLPARNFKVAVNKMYISYNYTRDRNSQYSDVDKIIIPSSYQGRATYYEDNIAIVVVKRAFLFHLSVRPVCLDFDSDLDRTQLAEGNSGKTAIWSHDVGISPSSDVLNVFNYSYLNNEDCNTLLIKDLTQKVLLTKDKFCARRSNGTGSDYTYAGSGLAFLESTTQRYYLRGVHTGALFGTDGRHIYLYTSIVKHERFIKQHL